MVADWRIDGGLAESATLHNPRAATVLEKLDAANPRDFRRAITAPRVRLELSLSSTTMTSFPAHTALAIQSIVLCANNVYGLPPT